MKTSKVFLVPALTFWLVCLLLVYYLSSCGSNRGSATEKGYNGAPTESAAEEDKTAMHGDDHGTGHVKEETAEAAHAVSEQADHEKDEFVKEVKQQRDSLQVKIEALKAKAEKANDKAKADMNKEVAQLEEKRKKLDTKMEELEAKTDKSWQDLKQGVKEAADDLDKSFEKIGNRFDK